MMEIKLVRSLCFSLCLVALQLQADEWPQFRGPAGSGVLEKQLFPDAWSDDANVAWSAAIPGAGWSSPVVTDGKVFLTTAIFEGQSRPKGFRGGVGSMRTYRQDGEAQRTMTRFELRCLKLDDGSPLWTRKVVSRKPAFIIHPSNTYATESPATDGERVFAYFAAAGVLSAFDLGGKSLWSVEIGAYRAGNGFGSGSSLSVHNGKVFVQCDNDEKSFVAAFSAATGKEIWRHGRQSRTSWATPLVWNDGKVEVLVTCSAGRVTGHDLESGAALWKLDGFDGSFSASPAVEGGRLFFGNSGPGSRGPLACVEAGATGDLEYTLGQSSKHVPWTRAGSGPGLASPVALNGLIYVSGGTGILSCYESETGERVYQKRLPGSSSIAASLWIAGDKLFALDETGKTFVIRTGREFTVLGTNKIDDLFWSTPAVAGRSLLLRGADKLYCIRDAGNQLSRR